MPMVKRPMAEPTDAPFVYFVEANMPDDKGRLIKIGTTGFCVLKRLNELQNASPVTLSLVAVLPLANGASESGLHQRFTHLRHHGEWFTPSLDLDLFIYRHATLYGPQERGNDECFAENFVEQLRYDCGKFGSDTMAKLFDMPEVALREYALGHTTPSLGIVRSYFAMRPFLFAYGPGPLLD